MLQVQLYLDSLDSMLALLPGIFTVLLALHLLLVQRQGMSEPLRGGSKKGIGEKDNAFLSKFSLT